MPSNKTRKTKDGSFQCSLSDFIYQFSNCYHLQCIDQFSIITIMINTQIIYLKRCYSVTITYQLCIWFKSDKIYEKIYFNNHIFININNK